MIKDNFDDAADGSSIRGRKPSQGNGKWTDRRPGTTLEGGRVVVTKVSQQAYIKRADLKGIITVAAKVNFNQSDVSGTFAGFYLAMTDDADSLLFAISEANTLSARLATTEAHTGKLQLRLNDAKSGVVFSVFSETWDAVDFNADMVVSLKYDPYQLTVEASASNVVTGASISLSERMPLAQAQTCTYDSYGFGLAGWRSGAVFIDEFMLSCQNGAAVAPVTKINTGHTTKSSPYELWIFDFGLKDADASATADPDGDSFNNLYEYAFGGDPTKEKNHGMDPIYGDLTEDGASFVYIYPRRKDAGESLAYLFERNGTQPGKDECEEMNTAELNDDYEAVIVRITPEIKKLQDIKIRLILKDGP